MIAITAVRSQDGASRSSRGHGAYLGTVLLVLAVANGCSTSDPTRSTSATTAATATATAAPSVAALPVGDPNATLLAYLEDPRIETEARGSFHTFVHLVQVARLTSIFNGPGPMALFVPTDEAFALTFTPAQLASLERYPVDLARLVNFHAANGIWPLRKVRNGMIPSMEVNELRGSEVDGVLRINTIEVRTAAIPVSNGYIYAMNGVLLPPSFQIPSN